MAIFTILENRLAESVLYCGQLGGLRVCNAYLTYIFRASNEESRFTSVSRCFGREPSGVAYFNKVCLIISEEVVSGIPNLVKIFGGVRSTNVYNMEIV